MAKMKVRVSKMHKFRLNKTETCQALSGNLFCRIRIPVDSLLFVTFDFSGNKFFKIMIAILLLLWKLATAFFRVKIDEVGDHAIF